MSWFSFIIIVSHKLALKEGYTEAFISQLTPVLLPVQNFFYFLPEMFYLTSASYHFYFSLDSSFDFFFPLHVFIISQENTAHFLKILCLFHLSLITCISDAAVTSSNTFTEPIHSEIITSKEGLGLTNTLSYLLQPKCTMTIAIPDQIIPATFSTLFTV